VSNATRVLDDSQLTDILTVSRAANEQAGITGLLLYKEGSFMQFLEGVEQTVRELLERITLDPRHYNVAMLQEGVLDERIFPDWSMGFRMLDDGVKDVPGYADFEEMSLSGEGFTAKPQRCLQLLRLFREHF
jgi:hypothetical protein